MGQPMYQVDAFTSRPFAGNPAAVCLLEAPAADEWMQDVAREMNLSETAFLYRDGGGFSLRWFTPALEVDLCGHATLASAHVLWETGALAFDEAAKFSTKSGELLCRRRDDWIEMDFPSTPPELVVAPNVLLSSLDADAVYVGRSVFDYLVEVETESVVLELAPDFAGIRKLDVRGVIVTAAGDDAAVDFVSRYFAPGAGVDEDPVTGSTHCCLAPFWAQKLGKREMEARQLSTRGGRLRVIDVGERVRILGQAVTVMAGELL